MKLMSRFANRTFIRPFFFSWLLFITYTAAQNSVTVHIVHPWANDPERSQYPPYIISAETGYYPGTPMNAEGGDWYTYTFTRLNRTTNDRMEFYSYIPDQYNEYNQQERYPSTMQLIFLSIFEGTDPDVNEVWIIPMGLDRAPTLTFTPPPGGQVICFLNPWDLGAPRTHIENLGIAMMKMNRRNDRCGWFSYNYYGLSDSVHVMFMNSLDSTWYGLTGFSNEAYIDLTAALEETDTVWIYPNLTSDSTPVVSTTFPNIIGECNRTIHLAATMRDIGLHPDFGTYDELEADDCGGLITGMVENRLGADGKPMQRNQRCSMIQFDWFETQVLVDGYTNETCYDLTLTKNEEGIYEFDTTDFFPLDSFVYLDEERTIRNPNNNLFIDPDNLPPFNVHFTMELSAEFEYHKGQTFYFRGDDDVWVFIDSQLAVDLGGNHGPEEGSVNLDRLGLTEGESYNFKLFFVERNCCGSNFLMQTSINLQTTNKMFAIKTIPGAGKIQYDLYERISTSSVSCNPSEEELDTVEASVIFYIEGPQFTGKQQLPTGLSYGGIYISNNSSVLTLDTTAMTDLETGYYTITYHLMSDPSQKGQVSFTVIKPPKPPLVQNPVIAAAYFADNGIGQVNRAEIYYTNDLTKMPDSIVLYWPEPINQYRRVATPENGLVLDSDNAKHITVNLSQPFEPLTTIFKGTTTLGTSFIYDTTFLQPNDVARFDIADSVGPLIASALLLERIDPGPDTLFLTFTEPVADSLILGASLLLKKTDGNEQALTVLSFSVRLDTLIILTEASAYYPVAGDSLRINPSGTLTDRSTNHAHLLNRPVAIQLKKGAGRLKSAYYLDRNADGRVDEVVVQFDRIVTLDECTFHLSWVNGLQSSSLSSAFLHYDPTDSTIVSIDLRNAFTKEIPVATNGTMALNLEISGASSSTQSSFVSDSAAPVVVTARYNAAAYSDNQTVIPPDTLTITTSEPLSAVTATTPLVFKKPGQDAFSPQLEFIDQRDKQYTFYVREEIPDHIYPAAHDSVYFNIEALCSDLVGNSQAHPDNLRALLQFVEAAAAFKMYVGPNPFDPRKEQLKIKIDPYIKTKGTIAFTVSYTIYDEVGSLVWKQPWPEGKAPASIAETIFWNGTNKNGRYVGDGTYIVYVKIADGNGLRIVTDTKQPVKVGVSRKR